MEYIVKNIAQPRIVSFAVLVALVATMLAAPLAAYAAPEDSFQAISVELYDLEPDKEPTLVITGFARDDLEPPIPVAISVPKGSAVTYIGQITDSPNAEEWIPIEDADLVEGDEYNIVTFELRNSPKVQLELTVPEDWVSEDDGNRVIDMEWISAGMADRARVGISTPIMYHLENVTPEPLVGVRQQDVFYSVETSPVVEGSVLTLSGTFVSGEGDEVKQMREEMMAQAEEEAAEATEAAPATEAPVATPVSAESESGGIPTWAILGGLAAAIAVIAVLIWRNMQSSQGEGEDAEGEDVAEDDSADAGDDG
jgi:hypothetical protein